MSLKDVKPGTYKAVISEGAWLEKHGKKELPAVGLSFQFEREPGKLETITSFLYLTPDSPPDEKGEVKRGAMGYTMEKLVEIGYDFQKKLIEEDGNKVFDNTYFSQKEFEIVIVEEEYDTESGKKSSLKVKYINLPGGMDMKGTTVQAALGNANLQSEIEAAKARLALRGRNVAPAPAGSTVKDEPMPEFKAPAKPPFDASGLKK